MHPTTRLSPYQLAVPTENRLRLGQHPGQGRPAYTLAQRCNDRPICRVQLKPLDLPAEDAKLVAQQRQLGFKLVAW